MGNMQRNFSRHPLFINIFIRHKKILRAAYLRLVPEYLSPLGRLPEKFIYSKKASFELGNLDVIWTFPSRGRSRKQF